MSLAPQHRSLITGLGALAAFGLVAGVLTVPASAAQTPRGGSHSSFAELTVLPGADADLRDSAPAMVSAPADRTLARPSGVSSAASDATIARAHLARIAPLWGIDNSTSSLRAVSSSRALPTEPVVRFAQLVDGVPVYGGGLVVALDDSGGLRSVAGDAADADTNLNFTITAAEAQATARTAAAAALDLPAARLRVGTAFRYAYDAQLVGGTSTTVVPAWRVLVAGARGSDDKVEVLVDARDGHVLRTTGATPHVDRAVCDGTNTFTTDASYGWCGQNTTIATTGTNNVPYARTDLSGASGVTDVEGGYQALTKTDAFYSTVLGYDLNANIAPPSATIGRTPNDGPTLAAIVRYCDPEEYYRDNPDFPSYYGDSTWWAQQLCPMPNAYWYADDLNYDPNGLAPYPGGQMFIGGGLASAVDVIAHEMTHGVTAATNGLLYSGQSGAINESMSDVFGQLVQDYSNYSNGAPANSIDAGWQIGEDANAPGHGAFPAQTQIIGAIRSMSNPAAFDQPATVTSPLWEAGSSDSGGVHTNSGVGNHAAYLIAHGGPGVTRLDTSSAVGSTAATVKIAHLYWAVQQVLPANADYRMLGAKLDEQCRALAASPTDTYGFTTADCTNSVDAAVKATGMTGTSTSVSVGRTSVVYGNYVTVIGKVSYLRGGGMGGVAIALQRQFKGTSTWTTIATGTTSTSSSNRGIKSWSIKPYKSANYRAVYAGGGIVPASNSSARSTTVTPVIGRTVKASKIRVRTPLKVYGLVKPGMSGRTVYLQQYVNGSWRNVAKVRVASTSKYSFSYKPRAKAKRSFRIYLPSSTSYNAGTSSKFTVTIT